MRYIILIFILCSLFIGCKNDEIKQGEVIVNKFYNKIEQKNYIGMDSLISFRFYQNTPYNDFKTFLNKKDKEFGKIKKKTLRKSKIIKMPTSDTLHLGYEVNYTNTSTKESFTLIKEDKDFKILKYYISQ